MVDQDLSSGQRGQPIMRRQKSLSGVDPRIPHCRAGMRRQTLQRIFFEPTEMKVGGSPDEPCPQPPGLGAVVRRHQHVRDHASGQGRRVGRIADPGWLATEVPMQQRGIVAVRRKLYLYDIHVRERTSVLGGPPQNPWLIKILGQPANSSSMPPPRLPLLAPAEPPLIGLVQAHNDKW
jgi:hypothetical protein